MPIIDGHKLDRKPSPIDRRDYPIAQYLTDEPLPTEPVEWTDVTILDQGEWGHCVGFGYAAFCNADPIRDALSNGQAHALYYKAKEYDLEPGQENGSSMRSGVKALKYYGYVGVYAFAQTPSEMKRWILTSGPLIVGTYWTEGMMVPDKDGVVHTAGKALGGHCYTMVGYDPLRGLAKFVNSWGEEWGKKGFFWMDFNEWYSVFYPQGEAVATVELADNRQVIPAVKPPLVPQPEPRGNGCLWSWLPANQDQSTNRVKGLR